MNIFFLYDKNSYYWNKKWINSVVTKWVEYIISSKSYYFEKIVNEIQITTTQKQSEYEEVAPLSLVTCIPCDHLLLKPYLSPHGEKVQNLFLIVSHCHRFSSHNSSYTCNTLKNESPPTKVFFLSLSNMYSGI